MSPPPSLVHRDAAVIRRLEVRHALTRVLARALPVRRLRELEFESRYQLYTARFGHAESDVYVSTFSKSGTTWA